MLVDAELHADQEAEFLAGGARQQDLWPLKYARHRDAASGRWWSMTLAEQLGNVGSEVSRALKWRSSNPRIAQGAMERALELIDLTLDDPNHRSSIARLREICRAREVLLDFLVGSNQYGSTEASLRRYFDAFAIAASKSA
jgi:hypothetical protein